MKMQEEHALKNRLLVALPSMNIGDIRDLVAYAEASVRENPRNQPVLHLVRVSSGGTLI